jgi:cell division protein FtsB
VGDMRRFLLFLVIGFAVASFLIYWLGDSGIVAYNRLDRYKKQLEANVTDLIERNGELSRELSSIQIPERTEVLARDLGLYNAGDRVIRLEGKASNSISFDVGNLLKLNVTKNARDRLFKIVGFGIAVILMLLYLVLHRMAVRIHSLRRSSVREKGP